MTALADAPSTEIMPSTVAVMDEYRPRIVMAPEEAGALDEALRANMKAVLRDGVDYGVIPGTGTKPTLLKPGAEKLLQWFGFGHTMEVAETERSADGAWIGVTYRCTVTKGMPDGRTVVVATCEGYAGYDEDRFYLSAEAATAKERAMAERYQRGVNKSKCVEYRAPRNSVVKMCQKRALVGAALQATSASTLFTQDVEDSEPAVTPGAALAAAASSMMGDLPGEVRTALAAWYRSQRWPEPSNWDAEQWCAALVQAGRLSAAPGPAEATDVPEQPASWFDGALDASLSFADEAAGKTLWAEVVTRKNAKEISVAEADDLKERIKARWKELAEVVEGTVVEPLDPASPWAQKIEEVASADDAAAVQQEVLRAMDGRHDAEANAIRVAAAAKAATFEPAARAA